MVRALAALERGSLKLKSQPEAASLMRPKISKDETRIDWSKPWREVHNHIRGLSPFPGAWFELDGVRVKALRSTKGEGKGAPGTVLDDHLTIACGDGAVRLTQVQRAGKQPMSAEEFLRGTHGRARRAAFMMGALRRVKSRPMVPARLDEFGEIVVGDANQIGMCRSPWNNRGRRRSPASSASSAPPAGRAAA